MAALTLRLLVLLVFSLKGTSEGWMQSNAEITGIKWAQQRTTVTFGIGIWRKPFILQRANGEKVNHGKQYDN